MSTAPALRCDGLGKRYGSRWALRDCSLELPLGTVTALVGPNGAGKTTLLQLVVGLTKASAGEVSVLGCSPRREAAQLLPRLGFVAQEHPLYKGFTIAETLQARPQAQPDLGRRVRARTASRRSACRSTRRSASSRADSRPRSRSRSHSPSAPSSCCSTSRSRRSTRSPAASSCNP